MTVKNPTNAINPADFNVVSSLDNDDSSSNDYLCSYCNTKLRYLSTDEPTGKKIFLCLKCQIEYIPANQLMKKASRFETPSGSGPDGKDLLTADPDEDIKPFPTRYTDKQRQKNLPPLFQGLKNRGYKWVYYEEH